MWCCCHHPSCQRWCVGDLVGGMCLGCSSFVCWEFLRLGAPSAVVVVVAVTCYFLLLPLSVVVACCCLLLLVVACCCLLLLVSVCCLFGVFVFWQ